MIKAQNLCKTFNGTPVVNNISFEVKEGETLVLLGTSGCGKTTTLRMINRLVEPTSGKIWIGGKDALLQPAEILRRSMGYVLQHHGLFPHYTVAENIATVPRLLHWDEEKIKNRISDLLQKLDLPVEIATAYPAQLSGGQQQRVGLARALAADPPILLMDEPFGALDPITRTSIRKEFRHLDELKRKTVVLVTHDVQEALELGDRICLMDKGALLQTGTPAQLLFQPAGNFVQQFFNQQRLQLELRSLRIQDIWEQLQPAQNGRGILMDSQQNLWEAMETITGSNGTVAVKDNAGGQIKELNFMAIQRALQQIKQNS